MGVFCTQDPRGHYLPSPGPDLILGARRCRSILASAPDSPGSPTLALWGALGFRGPGRPVSKAAGTLPLPPRRAGGGERRPGEPGRAGVTGAVAAAALGRAARRLLGGFRSPVLSGPIGVAVVRRLATGGANGRHQRGAGWDGRPPREAARGGPERLEAARSCGAGGEPLRAAAGAGPRAAGGASRSRCRDGERRDCDAQAGRAAGWPWAQAPGPAVGVLGAAVAAVGERCCPPPAAGGAR